MSIYEIKERLEDYYSIAEIIELLSNIDKDEVEEYAKNNFICPKCFGNLKYNTWSESRGECHGFPTEEEMSELICEEECGWVDKE